MAAFFVGPNGLNGCRSFTGHCRPRKASCSGRSTAWLPPIFFSSTFFDVGGIIGGILAGLISDQSGMSASTCGVMLALAIPVMFLYQVVQGSWCSLTQVAGVPVVNVCYYNNLIILVITGLLVNGPYALITTAVSAELGTHKSLRGSGKALATVTAIIDGTGSIGAAVGPFLAGWLAGDNNWSRVFNMLMMADVFALLLLVR